MKESDGFVAVLLFSKVHKGTTFDSKKLHTKDRAGPVEESLDNSSNSVHFSG